MFVAVVAALQVAANMNTTTTVRVDPLSWDDIADKYQELSELFKDIPTKFVCAPNVYTALLKTVEHVQPKDKWGWTIFGIDIEIDDDMQPGQWKFEYENRTDKSRAN